MALAGFKKLCMDAVDPLAQGAFWAGVLGLARETSDNGECGVFGPGPGRTIWFNRVSEPKTVKHRVHLDVYALSLDSRVVERHPDWTVMADPEGGEYCVFLRDTLPDKRLRSVVVDCVDESTQAGWWASVLGGTAHDHDGYSTVVDVPGMPFTLDFVPVPEPKTGANRIHWDLTVIDPTPLVRAGATLLRARGGDIDWDVYADPEGNEFCAFRPVS